MKVPGRRKEGKNFGEIICLISGWRGVIKECWLLFYN
jgi:hypothetical protein